MDRRRMSSRPPYPRTRELPVPPIYRQSTAKRRVCPGMHPCSNGLTLAGSVAVAEGITSGNGGFQVRCLQTRGHGSNVVRASAS